MVDSVFEDKANPPVEVPIGDRAPVEEEIPCHPPTDEEDSPRTRRRWSAIMPPAPLCPAAYPASPRPRHDGPGRSPRAAGAQGDRADRRARGGPRAAPPSSRPRSASWRPSSRPRHRDWRPRGDLGAQERQQGGVRAPRRRQQEGQGDPPAQERAQRQGAGDRRAARQGELRSSSRPASPAAELAKKDAQLKTLQAQAPIS